MPDNPPAPRVEPSKTREAAKSVARFTGRHTEAVTLASGIVLGSAITLIASLVK